MLKRLFLSVALVGATSAALAFGAFAYFKDSSGATAITITSGTPDIEFALDTDCDGDADTVFAETVPAGTWSLIAPGDQSFDCVVVKNTGTVDLNVYVKTNNFAGTGHAVLTQWLRHAVGKYDESAWYCNWDRPDAAQYMTANSGRGCFMGNIAAGAEASYKIKDWFWDNGGDQSAAAGKTVTWDTYVDGYHN